MMPVAGLPAAMHDGVNGNAFMLRLPAIVDHERKADEDIAANLRVFDDIPASRGSDQSGDCGLDRRDESVRHSWRGFPVAVVGGFRILEQRLGMKSMADG